MNFFNRLCRSFLICAAFAIDAAFGQYVQVKLSVRTEYTWFTSTEESGFRTFATLLGTVQGGSLGFLLGSLATADPLRAWAAVMRSVAGLEVPGHESLADLEADPSFHPAVLAAARKWLVDNDTEFQRFSSIIAAQGSSPPTSSRAFADDQTTHVHPAGVELAESLQDVLFEPTGAVFGGEREVLSPAEDGEGGMVVAGQPLWAAQIIDRDSDGAICFGLGADEWLRENCLKPAQRSLAFALAGLQEVWECRARGRPTLRCVLEALRVCVRQRFAHFARWFPPHIAREALHHAHRGILNFVRYLAGWSDLHFFNDAHIEGLALELAIPLRFGGAGAAPLPGFAEPAYVAAWLDAAAVIADDRSIPVVQLLREWDSIIDSGEDAIAPLRHLALCIQQLPEPAGSLGALWERHRGRRSGPQCEGERPDGRVASAASWQRLLTAPLWPRAIAEREAAASQLPPYAAKRERQRLSHKAVPGVACWLTMVPLYRCEHLEDLEARDWFSWWMGVPLEPVRSGLQPVVTLADCIRRSCHLGKCDAVWFGFEDHVFAKCRCGRTSEHDGAVIVLVKELRKLGLLVEPESWEPALHAAPASSRPSRRRRRPPPCDGDADDGQAARLDARIELLLDAVALIDYKLGGATNPSAPATAAAFFAREARAKFARYRVHGPGGQRLTNLELRAFIQSTFGALGPEARGLLRDVRADTGKSTRALECRLSIYLARAVARRLRRAYGAYVLPPAHASGHWVGQRVSGSARCGPAVLPAAAAAGQPPGPGDLCPSQLSSLLDCDGLSADMVISQVESRSPADAALSVHAGDVSPAAVRLVESTSAAPSQACSSPSPARRAGRSAPRALKPLQGTPGGIYGPDGRRLPDSVFFELKKNTFRARVTPAVGAHRRTIAEACADVASVRQQSAIAKANVMARSVRA